jgi:hypothetical protein
MYKVYFMLFKGVNTNAVRYPAGTFDKYEDAEECAQTSNGYVIGPSGLLYSHPTLNGISLY